MRSHPRGGRCVPPSQVWTPTKVSRGERIGSWTTQTKMPPALAVAGSRTRGETAGRQGTREAGVGATLAPRCLYVACFRQKRLKHGGVTSD